MTIVVAEQSLSREEVLELLDPLVANWFGRFPKLTPPQRYAIRSIHEGRNTLIASPTGSGKTLSAFLGIISELTRLGRSGRLADEVYCVYVSPLRSLNNDIAKNLMQPLGAIRELAEEEGVQLPEIRVGVRTGDTPSAERTRMLRHPPHILITTPETLAILLCAPKFRLLLRGVRWLIVDEIHELCSSKRGVHLTLTLERLEELCPGSFARIGLSATIHPLEEVARFLVGYGKGSEPECVVADTRFVKPLWLQTTSPLADLVHSPAQKTTTRMYELIRNLVRRHRTTLIFTNTRSGTERVVYHLSRLNAVDADILAAHHSSLSREIRKDVEDRLKEGRMRAVVTSTSLELGIDVGSIDLVVQIGSPKAISRCLQRVGRSGHALDRVSKGVMIAVDRDDLIEDAVIASRALRAELDRVHIPRRALDVLAQHVVGMALERRWNVREAFEVVRRSYCYRDLSLEAFRDVLRYLSGGYQSLENFRVYGKIWYDPGDDTFGKRGALLRMIYATNIGTIPDEVAVRVYTTKGRWVGAIEEEFLERLSRGDIFILGGKTYEFRYARGFRAYVVPVAKGRPTVPSWFSELLPLSFDLGEAIGDFRRRVVEWLEQRLRMPQLLEKIRALTHCDERAARAILGYFEAERGFLLALGVRQFPDNREIVVEQYVDPEGRLNYIFNCAFGRRVNDALSHAIGHQLMTVVRHNVLVTVGDSGFMLTIPPRDQPKLSDVLRNVRSSTIRDILIDAVKRTEMVRRRFRHCATRALMVLRSYKGHEIRVARQQINSQILMGICARLERFPVLEETYREVVEDVMDVQRAAEVLRDVEQGRREFVIGPVSDVPSPFTHDLVLMGHSDVVLMADKRALLETLFESVMRRIRAARRR